MPFPIQELTDIKHDVDLAVDELVEMSRSDWDSTEKSWNFRWHGLHNENVQEANTEESYLRWLRHRSVIILRTKTLEEQLNEMFLGRLGLAGEFEITVSDEHITLALPFLGAGKGSTFRRK